MLHEIDQMGRTVTLAAPLIPAPQQLGLSPTDLIVTITAGWALTDLTFEMHRVHEWQSMLIRTNKVWSDPYVVDSPAQRIGNLGAVSMPLGMVLAAVGWRHGSAPDPVAMVYAGSEGGARGAICLCAPTAAAR